MPGSRLQFFAAILLAAVLSGCFHVSSVISVRPDGSATVRDSVTFSGFMALALAEAKESGETDEMVSRNHAEARAQRLGEGVRLARFERLDAGYVAVFDVPDVRTLRYSAPDLDPDSSEADAAAQPAHPDVALTFLFEDGDPSTLRVIVQKPTSQKADPTDPDLAGLGDDAEMLGAMGGLGSMFGDARMMVAVQIEGEITETTAAYREGSEITLFDLPFSALFEQAATLGALAPEAPSDADLFALLDGVEGVRIQQPGTVRVRFR